MAHARTARPCHNAPLWRRMPVRGILSAATGGVSHGETLPIGRYFAPVPDRFRLRAPVGALAHRTKEFDRRRKIAALAATMLVAGGLTAVTVAPASAADVCRTSVNTWANAQAIDRAWIRLDLSTFNCNKVVIKHYAKPAGGPAYWTSAFESVWIAETYYAPELINRSWWTY